jgi:L-amino acid N-acyltransferase YncA
VRDTFAFPFEVCNCEAVLALVDSTNDAALNFDSKLGFREIARIPNGGTDGDLVVMQMTRAECRWLRKPH